MGAGSCEVSLGARSVPSSPAFLGSNISRSMSKTYVSAEGSPRDASSRLNLYQQGEKWKTFTLSGVTRSWLLVVRQGNVSRNLLLRLDIAALKVVIESTTGSRFAGKTYALLICPFRYWCCPGIGNNFPVGKLPPSANAVIAHGIKFAYAQGIPLTFACESYC